MPTYNRVVYHEAKHETDVTAECIKIKLPTAALHTTAVMLSLPLKTSLTKHLKHGGQRQSDQVLRVRVELPAGVYRV